MFELEFHNLKQEPFLDIVVTADLLDPAIRQQLEGMRFDAPELGDFAQIDLNSMGINIGVGFEDEELVVEDVVTAVGDVMEVLDFKSFGTPVADHFAPFSPEFDLTSALEPVVPTFAWPDALNLVDLAGHDWALDAVDQSLISDRSLPSAELLTSFASWGNGTPGLETSEWRTERVQPSARAGVGLTKF